MGSNYVKFKNLIKLKPYISEAGNHGLKVAHFGFVEEFLSKIGRNLTVRIFDSYSTCTIKKR